MLNTISSLVGLGNLRIVSIKSGVGSETAMENITLRWEISVVLRSSCESTLTFVLHTKKWHWATSVIPVIIKEDSMKTNFQEAGFQASLAKLCQIFTTDYENWKM